MKARKGAKRRKGASNKKAPSRIPVSTVPFAALTPKLVKRLAPAPALVAPTIEFVPIED